MARHIHIHACTHTCYLITMIRATARALLNVTSHIHMHTHTHAHTHTCTHTHVLLNNARVLLNVTSHTHIQTRTCTMKCSCMLQANRLLVPLDFVFQNVPYAKHSSNIPYVLIYLKCVRILQANRLLVPLDFVFC